MWQGEGGDVASPHPRVPAGSTPSRTWSSHSTALGLGGGGGGQSSAGLELAGMLELAAWVIFARITLGAREHVAQLPVGLGTGRNVRQEGTC